MRSEFARALVDLAERDERVVLLTGDLGFTVLEPFAERHPDRFFNVGVAEQDMVGIATGLAESGYIPFAYSIATFATMRPFEFIRNGPVLHELPVRIVGVGGGLDYGHNGVTHYALEDVGILRALPDIAILAPADPDQAVAALASLDDIPGPAYVRLGKQATRVPGLGGRFGLGQAPVIGSGDDVALIALGTVAGEAVEAAERLAQSGVDASVAVLSSVRPEPTEDLLELLSRVPLAVTVEAHYITGGAGSLVAELIAEQGLPCRLLRVGAREMPRGLTGTPAFMNAAHGLSSEAIAATAMQSLAPDRV